jgi:phage-related protein
VNHRLKLAVRFFRTSLGAEPVREWLHELPPADAKKIGQEIPLVQFGWPVGMPLVRKLEQGLWEVRVRLLGRIARVVFTVVDEEAVLLHGFIKKDRKMPLSDLALCRKRLNQIQAAGTHCL